MEGSLQVNTGWLHWPPPLQPRQYSDHVDPKQDQLGEMDWLYLQEFAV